MPGKLEERYRFYLAKKQDIPDIMTYIGKYWKPNHILAQNREFFEYEFAAGEDIHFVLARDRKDESLAGIHGYYLCSKDKAHWDIWGSMWSARSEPDDLPFLGVELARQRDKLLKERCQIGVGNNPKTAIPLLERVFKHHCGKLDHYYMLNDLKEYTIAQIKTKPLPSSSQTDDKGYFLERIETPAELAARFPFTDYTDQIPYKDLWYYQHRFFEHPVYHYLIYGCFTPEQKMKAILVFRRQEQNDSAVLRLVDYYGEHEALSHLNRELRALLGPEMEYIDFYCCGFAPEILIAAGFVLKNAEDGNIIPNYFEPFVPENIDIWYNSSLPNPIICKADADQDRPNAVK